MNEKEIQQLIQFAMPDSKVKVQGDGSHFEAVVVSDLFEGMSTVKRQQKIYGLLSDKIASGKIHAFTMKTFTNNEYQE